MSTTTVTEEIEYDSAGRVTKKTVKTTTTPPSPGTYINQPWRSPLNPPYQVWCGADSTGKPFGATGIN